MALCCAPDTSGPVRTSRSGCLCSPRRGGPEHCSVHGQADGQTSASPAPPPRLSPPSLQKGLRQGRSADHQDGSFNTTVFGPVLLNQGAANLCQECPEGFAETTNLKCPYSTPTSLTARCCAAPLPGPQSHQVPPRRRDGNRDGRCHELTARPSSLQDHHQGCQPPPELKGWKQQRSRAGNTASSSFSHRGSAKKHHASSGVPAHQ